MLTTGTRSSFIFGTPSRFSTDISTLCGCGSQCGGMNTRHGLILIPGIGSCRCCRISGINFMPDFGLMMFFTSTSPTATVDVRYSKPEFSQKRRSPQRVTVQARSKARSSGSIGSRGSPLRMQTSLWRWEERRAVWRAARNSGRDHSLQIRAGETRKITRLEASEAPTIASARYEAPPWRAKSLKKKQICQKGQLEVVITIAVAAIDVRMVILVRYCKLQAISNYGNKSCIYSRYFNKKKCLHKYS